MTARANRRGINKGPRSKPGNRWTALAAALVLAPLAACSGLDELLEAELPGQVVDDALNAPVLAGTLVAGAQADFECGYQGHIFGVEAGFANAMHYVIFQIEQIRIANRQARTLEHGIGECQSNRDPIWFIMHRGRFQAADASRRIQAMDAALVANRDYLIGKAYAYEGYATQLLAEAWCEMTLDGSGETISREAAMGIAEARFTSALEFAEKASGSAAQDIVDMALVGRARSRLNQGDAAGALLDAERVTEDFVAYATYDTSPTRRQNMVTRLHDGFVVHQRDRALMVDGVPDPRIPFRNEGQHSSSGAGDQIVQTKYADDGTELPFASWREAQLMIAEIMGGQTAVGIINNLRATVGELEWVDDDHPGLPEFQSADEAEILATVLEERRRELYLQGVKIGDDIRTNNTDTWDTGVSLVNAPIGDLTCLPVPEIEFL